MRASGLGTLFGLAVCWAALSAPDAAAAATATRTAANSWTRLPGNATDISVAFDGTAFSVDPQSHVWARRAGTDHWIKLPGELRRIDAVAAGDAWGIGEDGAVYHFNGTLWRRLADVRAGDVGAGRKAVFAVLDDGRLGRYVASRDRFVVVEGAPAKLSRVDVDDQDQPWVVLEDGSAAKFDGRAWTMLPGAMQEIATGAGQEAYSVTPERRLQHWNATANRWEALSVKAATVAVGADGNPWLVTPRGEILARQPDAAPGRAASGAGTQTLTQVLGWRKVRGSASTLAISADGQVAAIGTQGEVWLWKGNEIWSRLPGNFKRIAMSPNGLLWGIDANGDVRRYLGSQWQKMPGTAADIAIGASGDLWIFTENGRLMRWHATKNAWQDPDIGTIPTARRLAVDPEGRPWVIDASGLVHRHDRKNWVSYPGIEATDISVGPDSSVFAVADDTPWRYNRLNKRWEFLTGNVRSMAVGPGGMPWAITPRSEILASSFFDSERSQRGNEAATVPAAASLPAGSSVQATSTEPLDPTSFVRVRNFVARNIAIGGDGSVFAINFEGKLARWSNSRNSFVSFPGEFKRIAVAGDGTPWGVNVLGEVFRHDGLDWRLVRDISAVDISIGGNGTVIVAAPDEVLHRFNPGSGRFERILAEREGDPPPTGSRVAVAPNGKPWTIDKRNRLSRCDRIACEHLPQPAIAIAIGPEGSVFIVDTDRRLRRLNRAGDEWDYINIDAESVAVGPAGRPWITNAHNELWASRFFVRNEATDTVTAATSSSKTTTSPTPVFTFLVNIPFDTVTQPVGFSGNPAPPVVIAFKPGGQAVIIDSGLSFWNYDESRKTLVQDSSIPSPNAALNGNNVRTFSIAPDGTYWIATDDSSGEANVVRLKGKQWVAVPGVRDCSITPGCTFTGVAASVSAGINGEVYATSTGSNLYRYDPVQQRFVKSPLPRPNGGAQKVSVDPSGRLWVASISDNRINEFDGKTWVNRSATNFASTATCRTSNYLCVSIGANGAIFAVNSADTRLVRWNPLGNTWDRVTSSPTIPTDGNLAVAPDGRPWVWTATTIQKAR